MARRKRKNKPPRNCAQWIAGEIKIESYEDEKELFEVISIQKEGQNLVRQFGSKKAANKFYNTISRLQAREREKGVLVSSYTTMKTHKLKGHKGCRICGRHPLMGEDFCSDHI